jgi:hypothetical protein
MSANGSAGWRRFDKLLDGGIVAAGLIGSRYRAKVPVFRAPDT